LNSAIRRPSRRQLLKTGLAAAGLRAIPSFAAGLSGRALVCIYLFGGNDSNNMLVPLADYDAYAAVRGPLALPKGSLLPVTSAADQIQYGFHPALSEVAQLFEAGSLAVVANVGPMTPPGMVDSYLSYFYDGYATPQGAAEMAEVTAQDRKSLFVDLPNLYPANGNRSSSLSLVAPGVSSTRQLRQAVNDAAGNGGAEWRVQFPQTGLGQDLRQAAALIRAAGSLNMERQIFLVGLSGFQTQTNSVEAQSALYRELSTAMAAFYSATQEMGRERDVTTYTDSEFSRTLKPDRRGFPAPAWGGHQLAMGGGVLGRGVYGVFPAPALGGPQDPQQTGVFLPTSSKEQYYATFANWFGMPPYEIRKHLPGLANSGRMTLGFTVNG